MEAAGAGEAELLVITIGDIEKSRSLIELAKKHYPHLKIVVNADDRQAAFKLMDLQIDNIRRETFGSALTLGQDALQRLGVDPYGAYRIARIFSKKDEEMMPELYQLQNEEESYISHYQQKHADLEALMTRDLSFDSEELDKAWAAKNPEL